MTVLISGRVQGVGYRVFVRRRALDLQLVGYVENLADGRVEIVAEGVVEKLEQLLVRLRVGPPHAYVDNLEIVWGESGNLEGFFIY